MRKVVIPSYRKRDNKSFMSIVYAEDFLLYREGDLNGINKRITMQSPAVI